MAMYLSVKQAAKQSGYHENTIRRMIKDGRLKGHHVSTKSIRIDENDLRKCLTGTEVT